MQQVQRTAAHSLGYRCCFLDTQEEISYLQNGQEDGQQRGANSSKTCDDRIPAQAICKMKRSASYVTVRWTDTMTETVIRYGLRAVFGSLQRNDTNQKPPCSLDQIGNQNCGAMPGCDVCRRAQSAVRQQIKK